jgi:hypothetical protein
MQTITSASTSINKTKVPALFKKIHWTPYTTNIDFGGGKFNTASDYLWNNYRIASLIFDPYNRTYEENEVVLNYAKEFNGVDTVTCSNVLNVIKGEKGRKVVILNCFDLLKTNGCAYFSVYEGNKSGIGKQTGKDRWQENRRLSSYYTEIYNVLNDYNCLTKQFGGVIVVCKK